MKQINGHSLHYLIQEQNEFLINDKADNNSIFEITDWYICSKCSKLFKGSDSPDKCVKSNIINNNMITLGNSGLISKEEHAKILVKVHKKYYGK